MMLSSCRCLERYLFSRSGLLVLLAINSVKAAQLESVHLILCGCRYHFFHFLLCRFSSSVDLFSYTRLIVPYNVSNSSYGVTSIYNISLKSTTCPSKYIRDQNGVCRITRENLSSPPPPQPSSSQDKMSYATSSSTSTTLPSFLLPPRNSLLKKSSSYP